jgi:hypothetical protein
MLWVQCPALQKQPTKNKTMVQKIVFFQTPGKNFVIPCEGKDIN